MKSIFYFSGDAEYHDEIKTTEEIIASHFQVINKWTLKRYKNESDLADSIKDWKWYNMNYINLKPGGKP